MSDPKGETEGEGVNSEDIGFSEETVSGMGSLVRTAIERISRTDIEETFSLVFPDLLAIQKEYASRSAQIQTSGSTLRSNNAAERGRQLLQDMIEEAATCGIHILIDINDDKFGTIPSQES